MTAEAPSPPPDQPTASPPRGLPPEVTAALAGEWGRGAVAAVTVVAVLFGTSLAVTAVGHLSAPEAVEVAGQRVEAPETSLADVPLAALSSIYLWHGVGLDVDVDDALPGVGFPIGVRASLSFALILGALFAGVLLFAAGRRVPGRNPGPPWLRWFHGVKVAAPYAVLLLVLSPLGGGGGLPPALGAAAPIGSAEAAVSPAGALAMPFLLAAVAAGAGALGDPRTSAPTLRLLAGAAAGAWRMTWLAIALAVVGFLVVAAIHPDVTRSYLEFVSRGGTLGIVRGALTTVFLLGNVGVYVAAASAGSAVGFSSVGGSCTLVSYLSFPAGARAAAPVGPAFTDPCSAVPFEAGTAPAGYFLFLLVPAVASVLGGHLAARRAGAITISDGLAVGAAAGAAHAALLTFLAAMGRVSYEIEAAVLSLDAALGPALPATFFLALLWGTAGGTMGGWIAARPAGAPAEAENGDGPGAPPGPAGRNP